MRLKIVASAFAVALHVLVNFHVRDSTFEIESFKERGTWIPFDENAIPHAFHAVHLPDGDVGHLEVPALEKGCSQRRKDHGGKQN